MMDRSPPDSPPSHQDPNRPPGDQDPNLPPGDQDPNLPHGGQDPNLPPGGQDPNLPRAGQASRRRPKRDGSSAADKRQGKRPVDETNSPTLPAISKEMAMMGGCPPYSKRQEQINIENAMLRELLKDREMRLEDVKLQEELSKTATKLRDAKRNIIILKKEKKQMETSYDAVLGRAVRKIKKKARMACKKWFVKKQKEARYAIKYFEMESGLKMINRFRADQNLDLAKEEERLKMKQLDIMLAVALLTSSFLDKSGAGPSGTALESDADSSSDDDAGPSGTALEPDTESSDDE